MSDMNGWDVIILLVVAAIVLWGAGRIKKGKARCGGDCAHCGQSCAHRTDTKE